MAKLHNAGRTAIVEILKDQMSLSPTSTLIAYGTGQAWWASAQIEEVTFNADGSAQLTYPVDANAEVIIKSLSGGVLLGFDVTPDGLITQTAGTTIPDEATVAVTYKAGIGVHDIDTNTLHAEIGRCPVTAVDYAQPLEEAVDQNQASFQFSGVSYVISQEPTRMLLVRTRLNEPDGVGPPISEHALFINCEVDAALPAGTEFFEPADVTEKGMLLISLSRSPIPHDGSIGLDTTIIFEI